MPTLARKTRETTYSFTLLVDTTGARNGAAVDLLDDAVLDRLYEAGCDDATIGRRNGVMFVDFDREAASLAEAITTAIRQVESAAPGTMVMRVEPEDLVSAADIARRTHRSRESIRQLMNALRGPGSFPGPAAWLSRKQPLWHWASVAEWFADNLGQTVDDVPSAVFVAAMNAALDLRRHTQQFEARGDFDAITAVNEIRPLLLARLERRSESKRERQSPIRR